MKVMNLTLRLSLLVSLVSQVFSAASTSDSSDIYFMRAFQDISESINSPEDFNRKMCLMNMGSKLFEASKDTKTIEISDVKKYFEAQENISKVILETESVIDFNSQVMSEFASHLIYSLDEEPDNFTPDLLHYVFGILFAACGFDNAPQVRYLLSKNIYRLSKVSRIKTFDFMLRFVNTRTTFLSSDVLNADYVSAAKVESFTNYYIVKLFVKLSEVDEEYSKHFKVIATNLTAIAFAVNVKFDDLTYKFLLNGLKQSISEINPLIINDILDSLNMIAVNVKGKRELIRIIIDIMLDENILGNIDLETINSSFIILMNTVKRADVEYFDQSLLSKADRLQNYTKHLKLFVAASVYVNALKSLDAESNRINFEFAMKSATELRKIYKACPEAVRSINDLSSSLQGLIVKIKSVFFNHSHENNTYALGLIAQISFLDFEMLEGTETGLKEISGNISYSIGHLIKKSGSTGVYPTELVQDALPHIQLIIEKLLRVVKKSRQEMEILDLSAHLAFVKLHPSPEVVYSISSELCYTFIILKPIYKKGYLYVTDLDFIDEYSVVRAGFFYFLEKYLENPCIEDRPHLSDYFYQLLEKEFVSKTEMMSLSRIIYPRIKKHLDY